MFFVQFWRVLVEHEIPTSLKEDPRNHFLNHEHSKILLTQAHGSQPSVSAEDLVMLNRWM